MDYHHQHITPLQLKMPPLPLLLPLPTLWTDISIGHHAPHGQLDAYSSISRPTQTYVSRALHVNGTTNYLRTSTAHFTLASVHSVTMITYLFGMPSWSSAQMFTYYGCLNYVLSADRRFLHLSTSCLANAGPDAVEMLNTKISGYATIIKCFWVISHQDYIHLHRCNHGNSMAPHRTSVSHHGYKHCHGNWLLPKIVAKHLPWLLLDRSLLHHNII